MKKIARTFLFTIISVYLTTLWNQGFNISTDIENLIYISVILSIVFLVIQPILKLIIFPINFVTMGVLGAVLNFILFYYVFNNFLGINIFETTLLGIKLSPLFNLVLVVLSITFINNLLDKLL
ncbi:MAG: hypothetical protein KatS3mg090_0904 [Patescibacteria group bacterium]|nr:MAG: hypothetical protein KatS3mg090_0904 [Patescibacteria group bacterium]